MKLAIGGLVRILGKIAASASIEIFKNEMWNPALSLLLEIR